MYANYYYRARRLGFCGGGGWGGGGGVGVGGGGGGGVAPSHQRDDQQTSKF